ncbi:aquaporin [Sphingopyxis indica]|uniref:Glycerol uptake facilitator (Major Intrinsic Protein Family) n=1 Tax=Sphingopyxis indica TaxID=436663 RepID=A0A239DLD1_9SPHN|nr:Glycerol uptake facilitator (Major Intrinsic Protein Family) [Sphingopyxis indica]
MADAASLGRRVAAEGVGAFFLFACVIGSGIMAQALAGGNNGVALLANTIATGAILFVLITMLGPISGAHFNPAVTLVAAMRRDLPWLDAAAYLAAQFALGIAGAWAAHLMFDLPTIQFSAKVRTGLGQWAGEFIATFGLVMTILGTVRHKPQAVAASVALYIMAAYWFTSSTSFANPAITVARSLSDTFAGIAPHDVPAFLAAQIAGAIVASRVAALLFRPSS